MLIIISGLDGFGYKSVHDGGILYIILACARRPSTRTTTSICITGIQVH